MLVLTRKPGEKVIIGNAITVTVVAISGGCVRVGIDAPQHVAILREELLTSHDNLRGGNVGGNIDRKRKRNRWDTTTADVGQAHHQVSEPVVCPE